MKAVVVDDEPLARDLLCALLAEMPDVEVVGDAGDGAGGLAVVRETGADLVFLDIDMPGLNGVLAAAEIRRAGVEVIFVTAHEGHAVEAFELDAADYLMKPVRRLRLAAAVERARQRLATRAPPPPGSGEEDALWVPLAQGAARIALREVVRVEAAGDYVELHTAQRAYLYRATMGALQPRLEAAGLLRVHRSAFIRPDDLQAIRQSGRRLTLRLESGAEIPVGPNYRAAVLSALKARPL